MPKKPHRPPSFVRRERPLPQAVTFHINAKTSNDVQRVRSEIQTIIKDNYTEEEEHNSCLEFIDHEDVAKILGHQTDMAIVDLGKGFEATLHLWFDFRTCLAFAPILRN